MTRVTTRNTAATKKSVSPPPKPTPTKIPPTKIPPTKKPPTKKPAIQKDEVDDEDDEEQESNESSEDFSGSSSYSEEEEEGDDDEEEPPPKKKKIHLLRKERIIGVTMKGSRPFWRRTQEVRLFFIEVNLIIVTYLIYMFIVASKPPLVLPALRGNGEFFFLLMYVYP